MLFGHMWLCACVYAVRYCCDIQTKWQINFNYLKNIETSETQTTNKSSRLKADRQNAPLWNTKPYDISLRSSSIVKTVVKK